MHEHGNHIAHSPKEEQIALLTYMISHNKSHTDEIHEVAHGASEDAAQLLHEAVDLYNAGTEKLTEALALIKEK